MTSNTVAGEASISTSRSIVPYSIEPSLMCNCSLHMSLPDVAGLRNLLLH